VRAIRNPMSRKFEAMEKEGLSEEELIEFGTGKLRLAVEEGDVAWGSIMAGQVSGLIHDVLPAAEILRRTVAEAEEILSQRLPALVVAS
jgi:enoyl-[acyl-carrier protein] reductase II